MLRTRYDSAYTSTVATAIPVIFVALVVDLGLGRGSRTPRAALAVLSIVLVLLISELVSLNALSNHRELRPGESDLVAGAMLFSGLLIFFRVAGPLVDVVRTHAAGKWVIGIGVGGFIVLWILKSQDVISGGTALVIFGTCVLFGGVIFPSIGAFISWASRPRPYVSGQQADASANVSDSEDGSSESPPRS